jgi:RNA-directed DNA polymerase
MSRLRQMMMHDLEHARLAKDTSSSATWGRSNASRRSIAGHSSKKRLRTKLKAIRQHLFRRRHQPIPAQGAWLASVVRGYFAYHAVPTNVGRVGTFREEVIRAWRHALRRRGQRDRTTWDRMLRLGQQWIPQPRILHPWPDERFDVRTRGRSRVR